MHVPICNWMFEKYIITEANLWIAVAALKSLYDHCRDRMYFEYDCHILPGVVDKN
jgi:hypothetical protein